MKEIDIDGVPPTKRTAPQLALLRNGGWDRSRRGKRRR